MRVAVFAYNFPHRKTQEFLLRLFLEDADVGVVLAADPVKLDIPLPTVRVKPKYGALVHPRVICERVGWRYEVVEHNSGRCADVLREERVDVGIIAGARILKEPVLSSTARGIVNFHPGLLPEGRGLDALQWALYEGRPIGVTAHLVDQRVDAGRIVLRREIPVQVDDTLIDLSQRLQDTETDMVPEVLTILATTPVGELPGVGIAPLHRKMPPELEKELGERLRQRQDGKLECRAAGRGD